MSLSTSYLPLLLTMALASYACRAAGFFLMKFVPMTDRLDHALKATPLAVMAGIAAITAVNGSVAEWIGLICVIGCMWLTRNDLIAALAGVAAVGGIRYVL
jgi:branched chain amino acid efflux pump